MGFSFEYDPVVPGLYITTELASLLALMLMDSVRGVMKIFMICADISPSAVMAAVHLGRAWISQIIKTASINLRPGVRRW